MIVYVVTSGEYEMEGVEGVFGDRAMARQVAKECDGRVQPFELNRFASHWSPPRPLTDEQEIIYARSLILKAMPKFVMASMR